MDKSERDFIGNNPSIGLNLSDVTYYGSLLIIFTLLLIISFFLKKKISTHMKKRQKLIEHAEEYERKRNSRNDLKVIYFFKYFISTTIIGPSIEVKYHKQKI